MVNNLVTYCNRLGSVTKKRNKSESVFMPQKHQQKTFTLNCLLCKYREQIIGYENEQGAPQVGHHHHVVGIGTNGHSAVDHGVHKGHRYRHDYDHTSSHGHNHTGDHGHGDNDTD